MTENVRKNQYIGIGRETTPGVEVAPTMFFPFTGDLGALVKQAWLTRDDEAFGVVDAYPPDAGRITLDNITLNFKLNPEVGALPLLAITGQAASEQQGSSLAYKHTFTADAQGALPPSFTWEVFDTVDYYRLSEMRVKSVYFSLSADGHVTVATTWIGRIIRRLDPEDAAAPVYSTQRLYRFDDVYIYLGDRGTFANQVLYDRIESLDLAVERNIAPVGTLNQLAYATHFTAVGGRRSEGNNFVRRYQDAAMRDLFWGGGEQPGVAEYRSLELKFIGDQIAGTPYYYSARAMFPLIHVTDHAVSGESLIETVTFNACHDPAAGYFAQGEIVNTMESI